MNNGQENNFFRTLLDRPTIVSVYMKNNNRKL